MQNSKRTLTYTKKKPWNYYFNSTLCYPHSIALISYNQNKIYQFYFNPQKSNAPQLTDPQVKTQVESIIPPNQKKKI